MDFIPLFAIAHDFSFIIDGFREKNNITIFVFLASYSEEVKKCRREVRNMIL